MAFRPQTYRSLLYLLLAFPLGIAYFVFLTTGLALGFGLLITFAGPPILLLVLVASLGLANFERAQANALLQADIRIGGTPPVPARPDAAAVPGRWAGYWLQLRARLADRTTWTGLAYLYARFPLGIASFVAVVALLTVCGAWRVDSLPEAFLWMALGVPATLASLHLLNGLAWISGQFARLMLTPAGRRP